jgi:serine/threonine protein kinase/Tfp pilus assembly protein PilF
MKCPKCNLENPSDSAFCSKCGTQISPGAGLSASPTETLQTPVKELTTGSVFAGRYEVIEELGKGGMGKVYKVLDTKIKEKVALKLLKPEIAADEKTIDRFSNELKFARKIAHRNVCRMFDLGEDKGTFYITMEYVAGEDLKSTLARVGQLSVGKTLYVARQIGEGLAEAHRLGVIHRDLKPQNIMIDREGNARIMDFGIARSLKAKGLTEAGVMIGTPEYMSPEQVDGKEADQRSDLYAFGIILYEMLTGQTPFQGDTPFSVALKQKAEAPPDPRKINPQIPEDLSRLILKCLEKEKDKRYQSADQVLADISHIEKGMPTTERVIPARKTFTSKEITVKFSLRKLFVPGLIVAALILIALVIWQIVPRGEGARRSIAVITFKNQTGDKAFDYLQEAIPNLLITSLEQSRHFRVTTWERLNDLLGQIGKEKEAAIDESLGFELCRKEGIEAIVVGSYIKAGEMFATDVKVLDVGTRQILKTASSKGEGVASILKNQVDELSRTISKGKGLSALRVEKAPPKITDITTISMEAYNYFLRGREDYEKFYYADAKKFLQKAVELDPTFAVAYLWLGKCSGELGEDKAGDEACEKAKMYSGKATEKERLYIEASYASAIEKDPDKRIRILQEIAQKYPDEKRVHYDLAVHYHFRQMFPEAIRESSKALALDPNYGEVLNELAYEYAESGNFEKAIEYFQKYASVSPGDANPIDSVAELNLRMGKLDEAIAKYKEALEIKPDFYDSCSRIAYVYALKENYPEAMKWVDEITVRVPFAGAKIESYLWKGFYHYWLGNLDRALSELSTAADEAAPLGSDFTEAGTSWLRGWIYYDRGQLELGEKVYQNWTDYGEKNSGQDGIFFTIDRLFYVGFLDLKKGRLEAAKAKLSEGGALLSRTGQHLLKNWNIRTYECLQGELFLAEGKLENAIGVLEKSPRWAFPGAITAWLWAYNLPFYKDVLARAYLAKGDVDKAMAEYERLMTIDPKNQVRQLIHPIYHYRLAQIYEEKGMREKALEQYQKFLDLWKDADSTHPELADARKRLSALRVN